jgi:hypothetical protein
MKLSKTMLGRSAALTMTLALLLMASLASLPAPTGAGTLSTAVLGMFPKYVGEFAYADLKTARQFPWFRQLHDQMLPSRFRDFEKFLTSAGVDPNSQVEELAWGSIAATDKQPESLIGIALGQFTPESSEARMKQQKVPVVKVKDFNMYAFGSGTGPSDILFLFLDSNTAAFGQRQALEDMLDVRAGKAESLLHNDTFAPLIDSANGNGMVWAVLDQSYTKLGIQQLVPEANQFPQAKGMLGRLKAMVISVRPDSGLDARFTAICASPDDANLLASALQAGVLYRKYQAQQNNPDLAKALDGVTITPSGDRLTVNTPISDTQLQALLRSGTFAVKM